MCLDFLGAFTAILNNDSNPLLTPEAILVFPPLGLAAMLLAVYFALMSCFE